MSSCVRKRVLCLCVGWREASKGVGADMWAVGGWRRAGVETLVRIMKYDVHPTRERQVRAKPP